MGNINRRQFLQTGTAGSIALGSAALGQDVLVSQSSPAATRAPRLQVHSMGEESPGNLIANGDFMQGELGLLPDGWSVGTGNPVLTPSFKLISGEDERRELMAEGNGRRQCYGYVRHRIRIPGGKTYRMQVRFRFSGFGNVDRHLVHGVFTDKFNNGIFQYTKNGSSVIGEGYFAGPTEDQDGEVRLYFRYSPQGKVRWDSVSLEECQPIPSRPVKIAVSWGTGDLAHWDQWLDGAGAAGADVALMPELFNGILDPMKAETEDGRSWTLMASKARKWKMHVSGTTYVRRGDLVFNSAPLFDREGKLVAIYDKNMVYEPELDLGATPGEGLPVFQTDVGRIGIIICYDSWFPDTVRLLALRGAELVLLPNEGYYAELIHARSADNGVFIAVSSGNNPAGVWDSGGNRAGDERPDPTCCAPSAILDFQENEQMGLFVVTVDLSKKVSPAWWGGPMRSAPGGRRCRETCMSPLEHQIGVEAQRWFAI
jgi:predicted amidohydrolase